MKRLSILLVFLFALGGVEVAAQDKYPSKPVKVVVPFGPGSATDIVMRIVGEHMRPILGQPVVIENKPGAFGILAIEEMARSDRKSTRLNSSHLGISYGVFCLKKQNQL